ncbi:MAG: hypothetical protein IPK10_02160 [Bacteroidetes bacterium]|nr:hypothetical protein [Bacteroidota bacterium]
MANYKSSTNTTVTRDLLSFEDKTHNIYESLVVLSKRANHTQEFLDGKIYYRNPSNEK